MFLVHNCIYQKRLEWKKDLDDMFDKQSSKHLAQFNNFEPPRQLKCSLYPHQLSGIAWLHHRETAKNIPAPFYRKVKNNGKSMWGTKFTWDYFDEQPLSVRGSVLADDMGLGKTIQTLGLILSNPAVISCDASQGEDSVSVCSEDSSFYDLEDELSLLPPVFGQDDARLLNNSMDSNGGHNIEKVDEIGDRFALIALNEKKNLETTASSTLPSTERMHGQNTTTSTGSAIPPAEVAQAVNAVPVKTTLIVCPVTVMSNWDQQIKDHIIPGNLRVEIYAGNGREKCLFEVKSNMVDVLLVSYGIVGTEFKRQNALHGLKFHRIILDEAHTIRNMNSLTFKSVHALQAEYRLCLTGTPIMNKPEDILSILSFLRVEPLGRKKVFRNWISNPIKNGDNIGLALLRTMMGHLTIRRTKSSAEIDLPEKVVLMRTITFPEGVHKTTYDTLFMQSRALFIENIHSDNKSQSLEMMLKFITRLRQACCSSSLVPESTRKEAKYFVTCLNKQMREEIASNEGNGAAEVLREESCNFSTCEGPLRVVVPNETANAAITNEYSSCDELLQDVEQVPPKVAALIKAIDEMKEGEKAVIFSQYVKFLHIIRLHLVVNGHTTTFVTGEMDAKSRIASIRSFGSDNGPRFCLCSLTAGGVGINLTRANHCFLMDSWWNIALEDQAMDRLHRIGQSRNVRVVKFVMAGSFEEHVISIQNRKAALCKGSLERVSEEESRQVKINELKEFFQVE